MERRLVGWLFVCAGVFLAGSSAWAADEPPAAGTGEIVPGPAPAEMPPPSPGAPNMESLPPPPPQVPPPPPAGEPGPVTTMIIVTPEPEEKPSAPPSFKLESGEGTSLRIGLLLQPQFQSASSTALDSYANNLYIRRTRILLGGTLFGVFEYFLDTDYPNLFLANNVAGAGGAPDTSVKATPGMNIQDAFATWRALKDYLKLDVGYMLPPMAHNAVQGATSLYSWDYFTYTFQQTPTNVFLTTASSVGRDVGLQARGLVLDGHLEYRAGLFQGRRNGQTATELGARNFFRITARLQLNLLDPETGFFYQGTYLGTKRILSVGGSVDLQDSYRYYAGDLFVDLPIPNAGVLTAQGNVAHWNGHGFIPTLPKQTAVMAEGGFIVALVRLGPVVRFEHLWGSGTLANQTRYVAGAAYWPFGHNSNLKAFYTRFQEDGAPHGSNAFNVQWQLYFY